MHVNVFLKFGHNVSFKFLGSQYEEENQSAQNIHRIYKTEMNSRLTGNPTNLEEFRGLFPRVLIKRTVYNLVNLVPLTSLRKTHFSISQGQFLMSSFNLNNSKLPKYDSESTIFGQGP